MRNLMTTREVVKVIPRVTPYELSATFRIKERPVQRYLDATGGDLQYVLQQLQEKKSLGFENCVKISSFLLK